MHEVLDLRNEAVSKKSPQFFLPLLPVEYMTSNLGRTDAPDTQTDKPNYNDLRCACTPRVNEKH